MSVQLSQKQLDRLAQGESNALVVRDSATNRSYAVLSEEVYRRARPFLELIHAENGTGVGNGLKGDEAPWTEAENERRIALIHKQHDDRLTKAEREELQRLQDRAYRHRHRAAPVRNEVLTLLLEALERRAAT